MSIIEKWDDKDIHGTNFLLIHRCRPARQVLMVLHFGIVRFVGKGSRPAITADAAEGAEPFVAFIIDGNGIDILSK